jgi:hypothetical protein
MRLLLSFIRVSQSSPETLGASVTLFTQALNEVKQTDAVAMHPAI